MSKPFIVISVIFIISLFLFNELAVNKIADNMEGQQNSSKSVSTTVAETTKNNVKSSGKALVGGKFELTNQDNEPFSNEDLQGKKSLVFFGFTNCPMICPTTISNISLALEEMGEEKASQFQVIFITTDPDRDTPERLKEYLSNYPIKVIGLTGAEADLKKAYSAYKVYAQKLEEDETGNYDMNHSTIVYVMDENVEYKKHFSSETNVGDIINIISNINWCILGFSI